MLKDLLFSSFYKNINYLLIVLNALILASLLYYSWPSLKAFGFSNLFLTTWDPNQNHLYGMLPFIIGTILTVLFSFLITFPLSISLTILLGEYYSKSKIGSFFQSMLELMAGIPTIIIGFWGIMFLAPQMKSVLDFLSIHAPFLTWIPGIDFNNYSGLNLLTASLVLSIVILPFSAFLGKEALSNVPKDMKEAAYALGATRLEVIYYIILPYAKPGILAGLLLSIGRALGETMAITLTIGNKNSIPNSLFSSAQTMPSLIVNEFSESTNTLHTSSIIQIALVLFLFTSIINYIGRHIIKKVTF